jgi:hypothetical protein
MKDKERYRETDRETERERGTHLYHPPSIQEQRDSTGCRMKDRETKRQRQKDRLREREREREREALTSPIRHPSRNQGTAQAAE